jgi:hypothetical protein
MAPQLPSTGGYHRVRRSDVEEADHRHRLLLRSRGERPRRRPAEQRDELTSPQLIELHSVPQGRICRISN